MNAVQTVKMRCPHCGRVVDTFDRPGVGSTSRIWGPYGRDRGRHPVGLDWYFSTPAAMRYSCHRKCSSNPWTVPQSWVAEQVELGADFYLP
jgi:hypothetical protein